MTPPSPAAPPTPATAPQLVAFDLDGTFLDQTATPPAASVDAVAALLDRGLHVAVISGRSIRRCLLGLRTCPELAARCHLCGYNGAVATTPADGAGGRRLHFLARLDAEVCRDLAAWADQRGLNLVYCHCQQGAGDRLEEEYRFARVPDGTAAPADWLAQGFALDEGLAARLQSGQLPPPPKLMVYAPRADAARVATQLQQHFAGRLYVAWAVPELLEIMAPQVSKGWALAQLAAALQVPMAATLAIGDGNNDLPMLTQAGVGVLMGNAEASVREVAAQAGLPVTAAVEAGGFAQALRQYAAAE